MDNDFLQITNLSKTYGEGDKQVSVLNKVNLHIHKGETVALLGRSGSGKSTLLNLISGIDKSNSGEITINDCRLTELSENQCTQFRRQHIGFVHQFYNLIETLTAAENIDLPLELNNIDSKTITTKVNTMLADVGLEKRADAFPDELSGGEQQRVALARALIHQPLLVLADEPTGNLDAETGQQVIDLMHTLVRQFDCTLLIVTHSMAVAKTTDRIISLEQGQLLEHAGNFAW